MITSKYLSLTMDYSKYKKQDDEDNNSDMNQ